MKRKNHSQIKSVLIFAMLVMLPLKGNGQTTMPEELNKSTLKEQLNYLEQRTRIYESYRAIREDMFQKIKKNVTDSLSEAKGKISRLNSMTSTLNLNIDSLKASLQTTNTNLEEITRTKNSIKIIGLNVNKITYNTVVWTIIAGLIGILVLGLLVFNRNRLVTLNTKKELKDLKDEFEAYRKTSREAREKMTMDHFIEMKKLKGG